MAGSSIVLEYLLPLALLVGSLSMFFASRLISVDNGSESEVSWLWMFCFGLFRCAGFWSLDVV